MSDLVANNLAEGGAMEKDTLRKVTSLKKVPCGVMELAKYHLAERQDCEKGTLRKMKNLKKEMLWTTKTQKK